MFGRIVSAGLVGAATAATVGVLAWLLSPVNPSVAAAVFGAAALPFGLLLGWIVAIAPKTQPPAEHAVDSAESVWMDKALAGTGTDVVLVTGLTLVVVSIMNVEFPTQLVLIGVILTAFASTAVRYAVARASMLKA